MRLFRFLFPLLLAAGPAAAQDPSNLLAGDVVLQRGTACRRGFTAAQGPGVLAPSITEGAPPTRALSAVNPVRVTATLAGHSWCRANEPSNLQAGDLVMRAACTGGWQPALSVPVVGTASIVWAGGGGTFVLSATGNAAAGPAGGLWCEL